VPDFGLPFVAEALHVITGGPLLHGFGAKDQKPEFSTQGNEGYGSGISRERQIFLTSKSGIS
jgi:hypothetical protein